MVVTSLWFLAAALVIAGPANIYVLDQVFVSAATGQCLFKRIQVHRQQIDGANFIFLHRGLVIRV